MYLVLTWGVWLLGGLAALLLPINETINGKRQGRIGLFFLRFGVGSVLALALQGAALWFLKGTQLRPIYHISSGYGMRFYCLRR